MFYVFLWPNIQLERTASYLKVERDFSCETNLMEVAIWKGIHLLNRCWAESITCCISSQAMICYSMFILRYVVLTRVRTRVCWHLSAVYSNKNVFIYLPLFYKVDWELGILFCSNKLGAQLFGDGGGGVEWAKMMCTIIMMYFLGAVGTAWFAWPSWPPRGPRYLCCWDRGLWLIWPQRSPRTGWCSWSTGRSSGNAPFSPFFCLSSNIPQCSHNSHKHLIVFYP